MSTLHHFREFALVVRRLRPFLGAERVRLAAVLASSLFVMVFEGAGVGLLVPLLSLLLGGENATPMRPLQWLEAQLPGHSPAFYVAVICAAIVAAIAGKNTAAYASQVLAADLKRRISVTLRDALFRRLHSADLDLFDRSPGGEIANVFLVETYRVALAIDVLVATLQRSSIGLFYLGALLLHFLAADTAGRGAGRCDWRGAGVRVPSDHFRWRRTDRAESPDRVAADPVVCRRAHRERDQFTGAGDCRFSRAQHCASACRRTQHARVVTALSPHGNARGGRRDADRLLRLHLFRAAGAHAEQLPPRLRLHAASAAAAPQPAVRAAGPFVVSRWRRQRGAGLARYAAYIQTAHSAPVFIRRSDDALRFERVSYTYPNGAVALKEVEFSVPVGQTVAIVGSSGSGKSTLAAILLRFRTPTRGCITVDGIDYWEYSPESWHRATALVEQDAFLFHGTLRENIVYGFAGATPAAIQRAIDVANLADVVAALPQGLDTLVGERGAMVSGGQRQRIAIARAVIRDPSILILDEATSHLDAVSEQLVQQALMNASRGRTTIVIAHRLSTIREADKLIVLEQGQLIEEGTWEALEAAGGAFQRLLRSV